MARGVSVSKTTVKAELSEESMENLIMKLEKLSNNFEKSKEKILMRLAEYTQEKAREKMDKSFSDNYLLHPDDSTGNLKDNILIDTSRIAEGEVEVYTDVEYAQAVEFGAGFYGTGTPYSSRGKDTERMGEVEYYDGVPGQAPHWFWLDTLLDLEQNYKKIANEVIEEELKKIGGKT